MNAMTAAELAARRRERRQIDLDPIVLVLLGIGTFTGAKAIRGYQDGASDQDRLNLAVAAAVLALAWVRPIVLRRRGLGGDPQIDDLEAVDRDLDYGDRVAVWFVLALGAIAIAAQQDNIDRWLIILVAVLAGLAVVRVALQVWLKEKMPELEGYLTPILITIRPTRLVLVLLGAWSVLAGLADGVPREGRIALLLFGGLLVVGAFLDGLITRTRRRPVEAPTELDVVTTNVADLTARLAALEAKPADAHGETEPSPSDTRPRPLLLLILVNLAALVAAGVVLYSALFDNEQEPAEKRLLIFAGLALLLAFIGDRIRSITISKDSISMSSAEGGTAAPAASGGGGGPAGGGATLTANAAGNPPIEQRLQLADLERLPTEIDLADVDAAIVSPRGKGKTATIDLLRSGDLPVYRLREPKPSPSPAPMQATRTLKITGRPRAAHKDIVAEFFRPS